MFHERDNAPPTRLRRQGLKPGAARTALFDVYRDDAAVHAHMAMPHFRRFAEATRDWLVKPFEVVSTTVLYPPPEC